MTTERTQELRSSLGTVLWIDDHRAVIVEQRRGGRDVVEILDRRTNETASGFDIRAIDRVIDQDRLMVAGPVEARTEFERAYVAVTHRPDRLCDVEPMPWTRRPIAQGA